MAVPEPVDVTHEPEAVPDDGLQPRKEQYLDPVYEPTKERPVPRLPSDYILDSLI